METCWSRGYQPFHTKHVLQNIVYDSAIELSEISNYKVDFDHDDSDTDVTICSILVRSKQGVYARTVCKDKKDNLCLFVSENAV